MSNLKRKRGIGRCRYQPLGIPRCEKASAFIVTLNGDATEFGVCEIHAPKYVAAGLVLVPRATLE